MSAREVISSHVDDYMQLVTLLFGSVSAGRINDALVKKILKKDDLLQEAVNKLVKQQEFSHKLLELRQEIRRLDCLVSDFAGKLGELEQELHDAITDDKAVKRIDGEVTKQSFTVSEVCVLAERLGRMSAAPAEFMERHGLTVSRPPAPQEDVIQFSRLKQNIMAIDIEPIPGEGKAEAAPAAPRADTAQAAAPSQAEAATEPKPEPRATAAHLMTSDAFRGHDISLESSDESDGDFQEV